MRRAGGSGYRRGQRLPRRRCEPCAHRRQRRNDNSRVSIGRSPRLPACPAAALPSRSTAAKCASTLIPLRRIQARPSRAPGMRSINALAPAGGEALYATDGSATRDADEWAWDLMERGRSGRALRLDLNTKDVTVLAQRPALRLRRLRDGRCRAHFGKLAAPADRGCAEWGEQGRAEPSARLSLAPFPRPRRRLVADRLHRAHAARRIRAARARLSQAHDGGDRSGILDRAAPELGQIVQGTDAGRASEDDGRGQALGAAALLRIGDPPRRGGQADVFAAQPGRRLQSRHRIGGRDAAIGFT